MENKEQLIKEILSLLDRIEDAEELYLLLTIALELMDKDS